MQTATALTRVDEDGVPKLIQTIYWNWRNHSFDITLFNSPMEWKVCASRVAPHLSIMDRTISQDLLEAVERDIEWLVLKNWSDFVTEGYRWNNDQISA